MTTSTRHWVQSEEDYPQAYFPGVLVCLLCDLFPHDESDEFITSGLMEQVLLKQFAGGKRGGGVRSSYGYAPSAKMWVRNIDTNM